MNMPKKIGLSLGGGGFFGAFEAGVLSVIEGKIPIAEAAGNSVGSITGGSFFAEGGSAGRQIDVWASLKRPHDVFRWEKKRRFALRVGKVESLYRMEPLIRLVGMHIWAPALVGAREEFFVTATCARTREAVHFSNRDPEIIADPEKLLLAICASCAIPGALPTVPIYYRGALKEYYDGGYSRNPLSLEKLAEGGCDAIIAVRCHSAKVTQPFPSWWAPRFSASVAELHNALETEEIERIRARKDISLFVVEPDGALPENLDISFKKGDMQKAIHSGARIAREVLRPLIECFSVSPGI